MSSLFTKYGIMAQGGVDPFTLVFTSSQTWTVPDDVTTVDVTVVGAGGGGETNSYVDYSAGGGGGGYVNNVASYAVTPRANISVVVGAGVLGNTGGSSSFGTLTAQGGYYGSNGDGTNDHGGVGGSGGSGGGGGGTVNSSDVIVDSPGNGGSNGSDGEAPYGGNGQGTTTYGVNGVLYAGGGGGAANDKVPYPYDGGYGGAGGGGAGAIRSDQSPSNGVANTGGGGGGCGSNSPHTSTGGSGIVIVKFNGSV